MKNKIYFIIFGLSIFSAQFLSCQKVLADDATTSTTSDGALATSTQVFNIEVSVDVPANCVATDTDGIVHTYEASSSSSYIGICALEAAIASSSVSGAEFSNQYPELGIFVTSLDGVSADASSQYWALYQNGSYANLGLAMLPVSASDTLVFELQDFSGDNLGDQLTLDINSLIASSSDDTIQNIQNNDIVSGGGHSSGGSSVTHNNINVGNAFNFLYSNENPDGSFSSILYTDWVAIAFATGPENSYKDKIINYEKSVSSNNFSSATDYERHAMALESLGINPYIGTDTNYIQKIVNDFDGTQIGDSNLVNDDIFAIFPLVKAGYSSSDNIIEKVVANIILNQSTDGSWVGGVDMTAAAIQALELVSTLSNVSSAISKAENYLHTQQKSDGGFGSDGSTSWALQAIASLGESGTNWLVGVNNPYDYLYSLQQSDGGLENISENMNTRIWETSYAISAAQNRPWSSILNSFSKISDVGAEEVGVSEKPAAAEVALDSLVHFAKTTRSPSATSSAAISPSQATTKIATSGAAETASGERVVGAESSERTSKPDAVSAATDTNALLQPAAIALISTPTPTTGTEKVLLGISSLLILSGFCFIMII